MKVFYNAFLSGKSKEKNKKAITQLVWEQGEDRGGEEVWKWLWGS